jgi:Mn-dependent DtxR family transcriptional regulator
MYLETIFVLSKSHSSVRAIDVSEHLGYSKPSVSRAMGILKNGGYIEVSREGYVSLTDIGKEVATKVYERHNLITELLIYLGVESETASFDACKIEHCISDVSFDAIKEFVEKHRKNGKV